MSKPVVQRTRKMNCLFSLSLAQSFYLFKPAVDATKNAVGASGVSDIKMQVIFVRR
jgi:hypothetical protein